MFADLQSPQVRSESESEDCDSWQQVRVLIAGLERVLGFGVLLYANSVLFCVLYVPLLGIRLGSDLARLSLLVIGTAVLYKTANEGRLYHDLKEQDFIKLSAFYNILMVSNTLLRILGKRLLLNLYSCPGSLFWPNYLAAVLYVIAHSGVIYCQLVVVQVALYSSLATSALLYLTTFITEIKAFVFKKTDKRLLFNMICQDTAERMELALYLLVLVLKAALRGLDRTIGLFFLCLYLLAFALLVDWIKYYFVIYLNNIRPTIFITEFYERLQKHNLKSALKGYYIDYWTEQKCATLQDAYNSLSLSFRYPVIPLTCVVRSR